MITHKSVLSEPPGGCMKPKVGCLKANSGNLKGQFQYQYQPVGYTFELARPNYLQCSRHNSRLMSRNNTHRTHKQFEYRYRDQYLLFNNLIATIGVITIVTLASSILLANSLDSPVRVQRHKQQQQLQSATALNVPSFREPQNDANEKLQNSTINLNSSSSSSRQSLLETASVDVAPKQSANRIDRVRRTNNNNISGARGRPNTSHKNGPIQAQQEDCPSNRLLQSLLPAEYLGSPAASQRQQLSRAFCDCTADLFGWHMTCFAGNSMVSNSGRPQQQQLNHQLLQETGEQLPNQLHPAFRGPQLQRQQQAAAAAASRRVQRSPLMRDSDTSTLLAANMTQFNAEPTADTDSMSAHEGFGEELAAITPAPASYSANEVIANSSELRHQRPTLLNRNKDKNDLTLRGSESGKLVVPNSNSLASRSSSSASALDDNLLPLASSASFASLQLQRDDGNDQETVRFSANNNAVDRLPAQVRSTPSNNHNLMFQTIPVLFSVKYMRNNMIEIDCDQAAPHYKPAMFQGFNVNEISSFTFNNCQLPNIPFSVLLHRTRSPSSSAAAAAAAAASSSSLQAATANGGNSVSFSSLHQPTGGQQSLKPLASGRQRHQNLLRKRRELNEPTANDESLLSEETNLNPDELLTEENSRSLDKEETVNRDMAQPAALLPNIDEQANNDNQAAEKPLAESGSSGSSSSSSQQLVASKIVEPKVKSLTVNLNTVVNQRTLVSLLTGLDLLEELQLNYMQLNLSSFEPSGADLEADPSANVHASATTLSAAELLTAANLAQPSQTGRAGAEQPAAAPPATLAATSPGATIAAALSAPTTGSSATTSLSTTAPTTQLLSAVSSSSPTPATLGAINRTSLTSSVSSANSRQRNAVAATTAATTTPSATSIPTSTSTTTTTTTPPPTTVSTSITTTTVSSSTSSNGNKPPKIRVPTQVQGLRPVQVSSSATRPSMLSLGAPRGLMHAQATGVPPTSAQTTTSPPATTVPSTVAFQPISSQQQQSHQTIRSSQQQQQQQQQPQIVFTTSSSTSQTVATSPGQRHNLNTISVAPTQSVSYTSSSTSPVGRLATAAQNAGQSTSSTLINTSQQLAADRIHHAPSPWFQSAALPQTASGAGAGAATTPVSGVQTLATPPADSRNLSPNVAAEPLQPAATSQTNTPTSSTSPASAWSTPTSTVSAAIGGLNSPANTPYAATLNSNGGGFGIRTSSSSAPLPVSLNIYNNNNNNGPHGFRFGNGANSNSILQSATLSPSVGLRSMNAGGAINGQQHQFTTITTSGTVATTPNQQQQQQQQLNRRFPTSINGNSNSNNNLNLISGSTSSSSENPTSQFVVPGGRLPNQQFQQNSNSNNNNNNNNRRNQFTTLNVQPTTLTSGNGGGGNTNNAGTRLTSTTQSFASGADNEFAFATPSGESSFVSSSGFVGEPTAAYLEMANQFDPTPNGGGARVRHKRHVAGESLEEFELSFGEILPNLRSLKLESFLDLSQLLALKKGENNNQGAAERRASGQRRFKRQFQPNDVPEKDEGHMSDSESDAIVSAGGSETGGGGELRPPRKREQASSVSAQTRHEPRLTLVASSGTSNGEDAEADSAGLDSEPGEILLRSASSHSEERDTSDWSLPPAASNSTPLSGDLGEATTEAQLTKLAPLLVKLFSKLNKLRVLQLSSNHIPYWPDNVLRDSRNSLQRLYLISNNIKLMGKHSLANLSELETLDISSNQLRQLSADLFSDLSNLRFLRACRNLFRRLPSRLFLQMQQTNHHQQRVSNSTANGNGQFSHKPQTGISRLESVDFSKNRYLTHVPSDLFVPSAQVSSTRQQLALAPIVSLNLSDCAFMDQMAGKTPELLFASLPELTSVSLHGNKLRELLAINALFGKNARLQKLDLSSNQLSVLSANLFNANASQITELQLHHNQLTLVPEQFLFNLRKLRKLSLAHNRLTQLNAKMFFTNQLIESIDLSHNQLITLNTQQSSMIPFGNGANLKHLNLAYNNLSQFESDLFPIAWSFYTNLNALDLSHNQFGGQISMPIFYTIADEMLLNLASNSIESVSVEALVQHEQILDRYAAYEADHLMSEPGDRSATREQHSSANQHQQRAAKIPTVHIRLTNNPIACDCMLEPLVSYSRRVAAATNPALVASIFPTSGQHKSGLDSSGSSELHAGSRYSVLSSQSSGGADTGGASSSPTAARQPQIFYQFKFNDLYCARPLNLQRKLLSHVSIGDLLCPIRDERLCPKQCDCHYQSAFKTAIVDCNNRQLTRVPEQLTDSANFVHFGVESAFMEQQQHQATNNNNNNNYNGSTKSIASVDKVIIRLDNNKLTSMEQLAKLFTVVATSGQPMPTATGDSANSAERSRFARAPAVNSQPTRHLSSSSLSESRSSDRSEKEAPPETFERASAQPLTSSSSSLESGGNRKIMAPVVVGRNMHGAGSSTQRQQQRQLRSRRWTGAGSEDSSVSLNSDNVGLGIDGFDPSTSAANHIGADSDLAGTTISSSYPTLSSSSDPLPISTAVLESAEEFRNKRYPLTCELYLDHNLIDSIPETFLEILDQVQTSSMQSTLMPPQAALPTLMLEPPIHTKLNHLADLDPMRASASTTTASSLSSSDNLQLGERDHKEDFRLFGAGFRQPLAPEKKAALMETINENIRLNQLHQKQQQQQQQQAGAKSAQPQTKVSVSPSLVVLSLRYNNLYNLNARMLHRLSKLIKSSNTKLYLGHNPFNCSDNFAQPSSSNSNGTSTRNLKEDSLSPNSINALEERPDMVLASPLGDQLVAASDASSGAYLEPSDDLTPAATQVAGVSQGAYFAPTSQPLMPLDCPVGQLKSWLTRHHSSIGDLDELYCVHMSPELSEKLRLAGTNSSIGGETTSERLSKSQAAAGGGGSSSLKWDHDHPWASSLMLSSLMNEANSSASRIQMNGLSWNSEQLASTARLIDVNMYDLCPYSGVQLIDPSASSLLSTTNQQVLISVAIVFILISLCLLLMLVYFGDTQTILAFVYIHMNPIYSCLRLNESHLDGEKLYDAFVSYSSADRDIVMELIEKLEQQDSNYGVAVAGDQHQHQHQHQQSANKRKSITEKSYDTLVTEADLSQSPMNNSNSASTLNRRTNSFQDLSTMSRSTSRIMMGDEFGGSGLDVNGSAHGAGQSDKANGNGIKTQHQPQKSPDKPYRLCIHERDWLPGHLISWNIVNSVQNSRRTILILSKEFIKSVWFQVEFHTAYYQMLEDKIDRLIVIVRGELPPKNELDKNLAFLLTTKTYLTWGEKWFWERLHYALPHRSNPPALVRPPKQVSHAVANRTKHHNNYAPSKQLGAKQTSTAMTTSDELSQAADRQKPLIMSSIGKDCSNLLLPVHHNSSQPQAMIGSSSSSGSSASNTRSSSSFLSNSSGGHLLANATATTHNDLLSAAPTTTRLTIGSTTQGTINTLGTIGADSGRASASGIGLSTSSIVTNSVNNASNQSNQSPAGVTSIMLGGAQAATANLKQDSNPIGPNSKVRAKKQEKLQSFVENSISNHFNLSEL